MRRAVLALLLVLGSGVDGGGAAAESPLSIGPVGVAPLSPLPAVSLARHSNGEVFFDIDDAAPPAGDHAARPRRVRVYWDHSAARADDDLDAERDMLLRYLDTVHPGIVDLVLFGGGAPDLRIVEAPEEAEKLADILRDLRYEKSAAVHDVLDLPLPPADACLYFSDGVLSFDPTDAQRIRCPLFTVSSAADANRGFLRVLARRGLGAHFDLATTMPEDAAIGMTGQTPRVVNVASSDGRGIDYALLPSGPGRFRIIGPLPKSGEIVVTLAGGAKATRAYAAKAVRPRQNDDIAALWAVDRLHELAARSEPDSERIVALARRYALDGALSPAN